MKKLYLFGMLAVAFVLLSAEACAATADQATSQVVNSQQSTYAQNQPMHTYDWSLERQIAQQLYDYRIQRAVDTYSIWYSATGQIIDGCPSKGFGLPYNTSLTAPEGQVYSGSAVVVPQAEPNGLYPGGSTDATWIMCVEPDGSVFPQYIEPAVVVYTWPMEIVRDDQGKPLYAKRAGKPDPKNTVKLTH